MILMDFVCLVVGKASASIKIGSWFNSVVDVREPKFHIYYLGYMWLVYDQSSDLRTKVKWPSARTSSASAETRRSKSTFGRTLHVVVFWLLRICEFPISHLTSSIPALLSCEHEQPSYAPCSPEYTLAMQCVRMLQTHCDVITHT